MNDRIFAECLKIANEGLKCRPVSINDVMNLASEYYIAARKAKARADELLEEKRTMDSTITPASIARA